MRERINRLAKGLADSAVPRIKIEPERLELNIRAGETARGELNIVNEGGLHMKGLVYSFDLRVKVLNDTFGGTQNRIGYEVDSSYLNEGDKIEGSFLFVTNGGEKEIPYCFRVESGIAEKALKGLKTAVIFGNIAKEDMEQALRLFEDQDFLKAPFMQDMRTRTIYEGIRGSGSRMNQLEEFLVALKIKEPVEYIVEYRDFVFRNPSAAVEELIQICRSSWGFINIELIAEGDFIMLEKKIITDSDFIDDICSIRVRINPDHLHYGKNLGIIRINSIRTNEIIPVEVLQERTRSGEKDRAKHLDFSSYIKLRLDYEAGLSEAHQLLGQMTKELERLRRMDFTNASAALLLVEAWLYQGDNERAGALLKEVKNTVLTVRREQLEQYCFYQYLVYLIERNDGQREALSRLLRKYLGEPGRHDYLFLLLLKAEPSLAENPGDLLARMRYLHREGSSSPFLYLEAWKIFKHHPELLKKIDSFELQVFYFAVRRNLMDEAMAVRLAELAAAARHYHRLFYRLLVRLYEQYPLKVVIEAICSLLIKGDIRKQSDFHWFEKALQEDINLTRLYEYYLYTLPDTYSRLLPKEVLMYFSYTRDMDRHSRSVLYMNIVRYMKPDDALYHRYERGMEQFTMEQLFESQINSRLAVLYKKFIYKDLIDVPVARVLPSILKSFKVTCSNPGMKYVVICYEELEGEDVFLLEAGSAYLPLYFEHNILLFQDDDGNRYADIPYVKTAVMEGDAAELLERCFEVFPNHPMLRLREGREILDGGITDYARLETLEGILNDLPLHPLFRQHLVSAMIDYLLLQSEQQEDPLIIDQQMLWGLIPEELSEKEHGRIIEILILQGHMQDAFRMIGKYGCEQVKENRLMMLCSKMVLQNLFEQDQTLLKLTFRTFSKGGYDCIMLDYLCEHFNGSSEQMYKVLIQGIAERVETYDMEERLLAQMMFTGSTKHLDQVFELYADRKKTGEMVVKAYFTVKSTEYIMDGKPVSAKVFGYLEQAVSGTSEREKIPVLYLLALTRHYAELKELTAKQKLLCQNMVEILLEENLILPYLKKLGRHIPIPEELLTSVMVEYQAVSAEPPEIEIRLLPLEQQFHREEMDKVFLSVYVKSRQLFDGETMQYRIYETEGDERICKKKGSISAKAGSVATSDRRFLAINEMCEKLKNKEYEALKKVMDDYIISAALAEQLFPLS